MGQAIACDFVAYAVAVYLFEASEIGISHIATTRAAVAVRCGKSEPASSNQSQPALQGLLLLHVRIGMSRGGTLDPSDPLSSFLQLAYGQPVHQVHFRINEIIDRS